MKLYFTQIYAQAGCSFPFGYKFQVFISEKTTNLVKPSSKFINFHGEDYNFIFIISAKRQLAINEIVGPKVYKKDKDVEYSVFLPYVPIMQMQEPNRSALEHLFDAVYEVLENDYDIDISNLKEKQDELINEIMSSPEMFRMEDA